MEQNDVLCSKHSRNKKKNALNSAVYLGLVGNFRNLCKLESHRANGWRHKSTFYSRLLVDVLFAFYSLTPASLSAISSCVSHGGWRAKCVPWGKNAWIGWTTFQFSDSRRKWLILINCHKWVITPSSMSPFSDNIQHKAVTKTFSLICSCSSHNSSSFPVIPKWPGEALMDQAAFPN